jgi:hypothetical protein
MHVSRRPAVLIELLTSLRHSHATNTMPSACLKWQGFWICPVPYAMSMQAVEALIAAAASSGTPLPLDIKFMLEGQEEILSPHLRCAAVTCLGPGLTAPP